MGGKEQAGGRRRRLVRALPRRQRRDAPARRREPARACEHACASGRVGTARTWLRRPWSSLPPALAGCGEGGAAPKVSPPATARRDGRCRGVVGGGDAGGRCRIPIRCGSGLAATLASSR